MTEAALRADWVPDLREIEGETLNRPFAGKGGGIHKRFRLAIRAVDFGGARFGVDQPTELGSIGDVFAHFFAEQVETVGLRAEFDDKRGAEMPETFAAFRSELANFDFWGPRGVRGTAGTVGENETG